MVIHRVKISAPTKEPGWNSIALWRVLQPGKSIVSPQIAVHGHTQCVIHAPSLRSISDSLTVNHNVRACNPSTTDAIIDA